MSDDLVTLLERLAVVAWFANHEADELRLMPAVGVADIVYEAKDRIEELEAKLAEAVEALQWCETVHDSSRARTTLAELTGERQKALQTEKAKENPCREAMNDCPSCREPLDYPSGDGCAAMTMHKEKPMTDYKIVSSDLTDRFTAMLNNYKDDFEEEIVVVFLMDYYDMCSEPNKIDNTVDEWIDPDEDLLWAIERVLQDLMTTSDFDSWVKTRGYPKR